MSNRKSHGRLPALIAAAISATATQVQAAFLDPGTTPWGGWSRSDPGVAYAGWNLFSDEFVDPPGSTLNLIRDTTPDLLANSLISSPPNPQVVVGAGSGPATSNIGFTAASLDETTGTAFITGGGVGNVYSPSFATAFVLNLTTAAASVDPHRVALQIRTLGSELAYTGMRLNGIAADGITELANLPISFGGFPAVQVDTLWTWTLAPGVSDYVFTFAAAESSVSLDALTVDVAPVPVPGAIWLLGSALLAGLAPRRRKSP